MGTESSVTNIVDLNKLWPFGSDPASTADNHLRFIKTALINDFPGFDGAVIVSGVDGGVVNAYTLTPTNALVAYTSRMLIEFTPSVTNTGAVTLNISSLGAKDVKSVSGAALVAGDLVAGTPYLAIYNGTEARLLGVTKNYIDQLAFSSALPAQPGGAVPYPLITRGGVVTWSGMVLPRVTRTSNTQLVAADSGQAIEITNGTFSQTFAACSALQNGWFILLKNSGTGDVTLDPNGAETIDGLASFVMYPGEQRAIFCDGTTLSSNVLSPFSRDFTASATFTKPPGYRQFGGIAWSGGQGGNRDNNAGGVLGGAYGGGAFPFTLDASLLAASEPITIGAGGIGATGVANGGAGGDTSIGSFIFVFGGSNGSGGSIRISTISGQTGKAGGNAVGFEGGSNNVNPTNTIYGGASPTNNPNSITIASGSSIYGGAASGGLDGATVRSSGASTFGGNAGTSSSASSGTNGSARGGAGGCTHTGAAGGGGGRGEVQIWGIV